MKLSSGQKICTLPFESVEVNSNGKLYFCCASWQKKPFGDLNKDSILSEWNSLAAKEIRQSILDGSYKFCNKDMCPYLQTNCLKEYNELTEIQQKLVSEQGIELIDAPISLMLNYDYSCNLSCPSCRYEKVSITSNDQEFPFLKSLTEKIVFDFFQNSSQRKIKLNITGSGDPFASLVFRNFLESLNGENFPNLTIDLQTNGVLLNEKMWEKLKKIHNNINSIFLSLDAASKETYLEVRKGGSWEIVNRNIDFLKKLREQGILKRLQVHFVVQKKNYFEMVSFARKYNVRGIDLVYFSLVDDWGAWTKEVFEEQAIWKSTHKEHENFLLELSHPIFELPSIFLGNLTSHRLKAISFRAQRLKFLERLCYLARIRFLIFYFRVKKILYNYKLKILELLD